jgi:hypothetical protein
MQPLDFRCFCLPCLSQQRREQNANGDRKDTNKQHGFVLCTWSRTLYRSTSGQVLATISTLSMPLHCALSLIDSYSFDFFD